MIKITKIKVFCQLYHGIGMLLLIVPECLSSWVCLKGVTQLGSSSFPLVPPNRCLTGPESVTPDEPARHFLRCPNPGKANQGTKGSHLYMHWPHPIIPPSIIISYKLYIRETTGVSNWHYLICTKSSGIYFSSVHFQRDIFCFVLKHR